MILNEMAGKYNSLLIQEPWIGDIGGKNRAHWPTKLGNCISPYK
jgi:hypothetical protein